MAKRPVRGGTRAKSTPRKKSPDQIPEKTLSQAPVWRDPDADLAWAWADPKEKTVRKKAPPRIIEPPEVTVPRGAKWLDTMAPDWFHRIDPHQVDVQSVRFCPLSCAFPDDQGRPDFSTAVRTLCRPTPVKAKPSVPQTDPFGRTSFARPASLSFKGSDTDQLAHYGFAPYHDDPSADPYPALNAYWKIEIEKRIASLSPSPKTGPNVVLAAYLCGG